MGWKPGILVVVLAVSMSMLQLNFALGQALEATLTHDLVQGKVINEREGPVPGEIEFYDPGTNKMVEKAIVNGSGEFKLLLPKSHQYYFIIRSGKFSYFFNDEVHIVKTSTNEVLTELNLGFRVYQYEKGTSIILHDLNFATAEFEVIEAHKPSLDFLIKFLNENPDIKIQVAGHTDNVGKSEENKILSTNRANSVMHYLVNTGLIAKERISAYGYGDSRPVASNETKEGKAQNRRTSFIITEN